MWIQQALTRALMNCLPAGEQVRLAADVVAWLYADLPPAERWEKMEKLAPRLLERIRAGHFGLRLVVYYHLLCLPPLRWLDPRERPAEDPAQSRLSWLVCRWY